MIHSLLMFAQTTGLALPDPSHWSTMGWLLVSLGGLAAALNQGWAVMERITGQKNRRTVNFEFEATSKEDCKRHMDANAQEHRDLFSKIGGVERGAHRKISEEMAMVHGRVNALEKAVGGLETSSAMTHQRLVQIDGKIDRLIERNLSVDTK